jgi:putative tryptophan/tyrosine transport system substrate-binding protein
MRRRDFLGFAGGAVALPLAARAQAQRAGKLPTIGFLGASTRTAINLWTEAFVRRLTELGWIDGRNVTIEYRWAEGRPDRAAEFASEFVRLGVNVIVTHSNGAVIAAKQATSTIPIVFGAAGDPVDAGLVASLVRPGGNVTGLSLQQTDTAAKRLQLLRELVPHLRHLAILSNTDNSSAMLEMGQVQAAANALALEAKTFKLRRADDIAPAFEALNGHADALYFCNDPLLTSHRIRLAILSAAAHLPTIFNFRENVEAGGLMSYGANLPELFRRAANLVDKILHGANAGDLPVEQPTKFDLVINATTAKAIGLTIPESFLQRADEVIE